MTTNQPLRVAIIGTAARRIICTGLSCGRCRTMSNWSPCGGAASSRRGDWAKALGAPWYTDLDRLVRETGPGDRHCLGRLWRQRRGRLDGGRGRAACAAGDAHRPQAERGRRHHRRRTGARAQDRGRRAVPPPPAGADQAGADSQRSLWPRTHLVQRLRRPRLSRHLGHALVSRLRRAPRLLSRAPCSKYPLAAHWARLSDTRGERSESRSTG
jgi:hypothetical protein